MMIRVAICDDDEGEMEILKKIVEEIMNDYTIVYNIQEFASGEELLQSDLMFHVIFLDIVLKSENGIEIGKQIYRRNHNIRIIFQTNYGQYCKEAMNRSHAFAFLEKPLERSTVEEQIREFVENNDKQKEIRVEFRNAKYIRNGGEAEQGNISIPVNEIVYFEYMKLQKEIRCVTRTGEIIFTETLNKLEDKMKPFGFETSCRGIMVNLGKVMKIKRYTIILNDGSTIPLSQRRVAEFKERVNEYVHDSFH